MLLSGALLLGAIALSGTTATADVTMQVSGTLTSTIVETVTTEMDFGSVEILPAGDTITIAAGTTDGSGGTAAVPVATGTSVVTGGTSGLITISSPIALDINVTYPPSVDLTDGTTTVALSAIDANSGGGTTDGTVSHLATVDTLIHVGGVIVFGLNATTGDYSGSIPITISYL